MENKALQCEDLLPRHLSKGVATIPLCLQSFVGGIMLGAIGTSLLPMIHESMVEFRREVCGVDPGGCLLPH